MLTGPIDATHRLFERTGLSMADMDTVEINEAFASVVLAWAKELDPDMEKVNPNGGAIALGHPLGGTGAVLVTKAAPRARAHRRPLRPRHDVLRRRARHRHHHRAPLARRGHPVVRPGHHAPWPRPIPTAPRSPAATRRVTRLELDRRTNRLARAYEQLGVQPGRPRHGGAAQLGRVLRGLRRRCGSSGATPQPVSYRLPDRERQAIVELADAAARGRRRAGAHPGRTVIPAGFEPDPQLDDGAAPRPRRHPRGRRRPRAARPGGPS